MAARLDEIRADIAVLTEAGRLEMAEALTLFANNGTPIEQRLSLPPGWHQHQTMVARDALIRQVAATLPGKAYPRACALAEQHF